jgi:anti-anti-sigma factor
MAMPAAVAQTVQSGRRDACVARHQRTCSGCRRGVVMAEVIERPVSAVTIRVIGQLRAPSTGALKCAVTALLLRGERHILLDLADLTDLDAEGIGELVNVSNMTTAAGGILQIARARTAVRRLLDCVGLLRVLDASTPTVDSR